MVLRVNNWILHDPSTAINIFVMLFRTLQYVLPLNDDIITLYNRLLDCKWYGVIKGVHYEMYHFIFVWIITSDKL